jgi:hypothetical protein
VEDYLTTINHDLHGIRKLLLASHLPNYNSAPVFSLFRDVCIMIYETNKVLKEEGIIETDFQHMNIIEEIRHKVKSTQGSKNREIFNELLKGHKSIFGNDIDNLGFYLDNDILAGSTLFPTFVFANTPLFYALNNKENMQEFTYIIGSLTTQILNKINQPIALLSRPIINIEEKEYIYKDIWDQRFFTDDVKYNVFLTRLLIIQNELNTCIWIEKHLDYHSPKFNIDKYILLRLTSIKLFETMKNLIDIKDRLSIHWTNFNMSSIDNLLTEYENNHKKEIEFLRNMLHYSSGQINFYDYLQQQINKDFDYQDKLINIIFNEYIHNIRITISNSIKIHSYESMDEFEKITRRLKKIFSIW